MNVRDLVPWTRNNGGDRDLPASREPASPVFTLQREMNRLFDDVFRDFEAPLWGGRSAWPQIEVEETETEYRVTAELPGLEDKDVEVLVQDGVLTLRGEKRAERQDRGRGFSERVYGRFERRLALDGIDEDQVKASFHNGLLTITAAKTAQSRSSVKKIPINQKAMSH
jgi:HSP20 family protein